MNLTSWKIKFLFERSFVFCVTKKTSTSYGIRRFIAVITALGQWTIPRPSCIAAVHILSSHFFKINFSIAPLRCRLFHARNIFVASHPLLLIALILLCENSDYEFLQYINLSSFFSWSFLFLILMYSAEICHLRGSLLSSLTHGRIRLSLSLLPQSPCGSGYWIFIVILTTLLQVLS